MYPVTKAFNNACAAPGRGISTKILFNGVTELGAAEVQEINVTEQFGSSDGVTIGAAFSSQCKVTIYKQSPALNLKNGTFIPYVGINVEESVSVVGIARVGVAIVNTVSPISFVPKGKYYIPADGVEQKGKLWLTVTGYDRMASLTEDYVPTIDFPATPADMLADVCAQGNITAPDVVLPGIQIAAPYTGSIRQQLGWLAGLIGCNAKFDATGNLVFCWYTDTGLTIGRDTQHMDGLTLTSENAFTINSLLTGTKENPISVGTGVGIVATNPYMTEDVAADVFAKISGKSMMPCKINWRGNPALEAGDAVTVIGLDGTTELTAYIMEQRLTVKGGMSAESSCYSPDNTDTAVQSPTEQKFQRMYDSLKKGYQDATDKIIGADGGNYSITLNKDGYPTGWTLRDTPTVEDITRMWIMSIGGLGFSKDGGKTISNIALTMDGQVVADSITTGTLTTVKIQSADGKSTWDLATGEMNLFNPKVDTISGGSTFTTEDYTEDDLTRLRDLVLGQATPTLQDWQKLDVQGNDRFDAGDMALIRQAIDGTRTINFTTSWKFNIAPSDGENLVKITKIWHNNETEETKEHTVLAAGYGDVRVNALNIDGNMVNDFVVERGETGTFAYRKWNSGVAEAWLQEPISNPGTSIGSVMGGYGYSRKIALPTGLFTSIGHCVANGRLGTGLGYAYANADTTTATVYIVGNQNDAQMRIDGLEIKGKWK